MASDLFGCGWWFIWDIFYNTMNFFYRNKPEKYHSVTEINHLHQPKSPQKEPQDDGLKIA
jgi:hypothetical protein